MKKVLGLMGGIATGKSTITKMLKALGAHIIRVDEVVKEVRERPEVERQIAESFGEQVLSGGKVDVKKLRVLAFADTGFMERLKRIVSPHAEREILLQVAENRYNKVCVIEHYDFEPGTPLEQLCDEIWLVVCDETVQKERLMARNGWDAEYAQIRIRAAKLSRGAFDLVDVIIDTTEDGVAQKSTKSLWDDTDWDKKIVDI